MMRRHLELADAGEEILVSTLGHSMQQNVSGFFEVHWRITN